MIELGQTAESSQTSRTLARLSGPCAIVGQPLGNSHPRTSLGSPGVCSGAHGEQLSGQFRVTFFSLPISASAGLFTSQSLRLVLILARARAIAVDTSAPPPCPVCPIRSPVPPSPSSHHPSSSPHPPSALPSLPTKEQTPKFSEREREREQRGACPCSRHEHTPCNSRHFTFKTYIVVKWGLRVPVWTQRDLSSHGGPANLSFPEIL